MKRGWRFATRARLALAARLGLDGNVLRRRSDRVAACISAVLLAAFLAGGPLLSVAVGRWTYSASVQEQRDQRAGWHRVRALLLQTAPAEPSYFDAGATESWTVARWATPGGHMRTDNIPVPAGAAAGSHVWIWVGASGAWTGPPLSSQAIPVRVSLAVVTTVIVLGSSLLCLSGFARYMLDRRRLAAWETDWTSVGPQWTRQFWARG